MVIEFEDYYRMDDKIFFVAKNLNALCSLDWSSRQITLLNAIPKRDVRHKRISAKIICIMDKLFCLPMNGDRIWVYDLFSNKWETVFLKNENLNELYLFQAIPYKDWFYLVGAYPAIVCINRKTGKIEYVDNVYSYKSNQRTGTMRCDYVIIDNYFYMADCTSNHVLKFDMERRTFCWFSVGNTNNCYSGIAYDGKSFYLSPRNDSCFVCWDGKEEVVEYEIPDFYKDRKCTFLGAVDLGESVLLPAFEAEKSLRFYKKSCQLEMEDGRYLFYKRFDEKRFIYQTAEGVLVLTDHEAEKYIVQCQISDEEVQKHIDRFCDIKEQVDIMDGVFCEKSRFALDKYLKLIVNDEIDEYF